MLKARNITHTVLIHTQRTGFIRISMHCAVDTLHIKKHVAENTLTNLIIHTTIKLIYCTQFCKLT